MNVRPVMVIAGTLCIALVAVACGSSEEEPVVSSFSLPEELTGSAMIEFLELEDYQQSWELWPGTTEKYPGTEPHGMLLTTYVNKIALDGLNGGAETMPDNSIIVKENYLPDGTFDATTVMYKVAGYNPEHNDWFWTKTKPDGTVEAEGQVNGCQSCHRAKRDNDYIYTSSLK